MHARLAFAESRAHSGAGQAKVRCAVPVTVCFPFAGGPVGGSHISAAKLIRSLDPAKYTPLVVLHREQGAVAALLRDEGIATEPAPTAALLSPERRLGGAASFRMIGDMVRMARFLRARDVRILHTNEGPMHATWTLPAKLAGARHVWHHRGNPRAAGLRYLAPVLATRVITVSRYAAPAPGLFSAARKSSVIYSPFDTAPPDIDRATARERLLAAIGRSGDTRILAFLGQFAQRKRPLVFVDAIASLRREHPRMPVAGVLFGEEFERGQGAAIHQRIGELGLEDNVFMMGFRQPIAPWIAGSDALVVPAIEEPFGRTLIEAMLLGTPVVAAASGGNIEAIADRVTGLLARPDNADALARQIWNLLANPGMAAAIAAHAKEDALQRFGTEAHVDQVMSVYRSVLA